MDISLIEFIVYGLVGYSGILMLIISSIKEVPDTKSHHAILRSIFLIPSIIACFVLAGSGVNIETSDTTINNTITAQNSSEVWTEEVTTISNIVLQNPVWVIFHWLLAVVLLVYIIQQALTLFTKF